jgi:hypothetical protein
MSKKLKLGKINEKRALERICLGLPEMCPTCMSEQLEIDWNIEGEFWGYCIDGCGADFAGTIKKGVVTYEY